MPDHPSVVQIAERLTATAVIIKSSYLIQDGTAFFEHFFSAPAKRSSENLFGDSGFQDDYRRDLYRKNALFKLVYQGLCKMPCLITPLQCWIQSDNFQYELSNFEPARTTRAGLFAMANLRIRIILLLDHFSSINHAPRVRERNLDGANATLIRPNEIRPALQMRLPRTAKYYTMGVSVNAPASRTYD